MKITHITKNYAVTSQISVTAVAELAKTDFEAIICNRPDDEEAGQPSASAIAAACENAGIAFHHVPVSGLPIPAITVAEHHRILSESTGAVLAYCGSGRRSQVIFEAGVPMSGKNRDQ